MCLPIQGLRRAAIKQFATVSTTGRQLLTIQATTTSENVSVWKLIDHSVL